MLSPGVSSWKGIWSIPLTALLNSNFSSGYSVFFSLQERSEAKERKRNILYLIVSYLHEHNLHESADVLANEAQLSSQFEVCDNIDLDIMYQDYESFYITKFNKSPKIVKKSNQELKQTELNQHRKKSKGGWVERILIFSYRYYSFGCVKIELEMV